MGSCVGCAQRGILNGSVKDCDVDHTSYLQIMVGLGDAQLAAMKTVADTETASIASSPHRSVSDIDAHTPNKAMIAAVSTGMAVPGALPGQHAALPPADVREPDHQDTTFQCHIPQTRGGGRLPHIASPFPATPHPYALQFIG